MTKCKMNSKILIAMINFLFAIPESVDSESRDYLFPLIKQFDLKLPIIIGSSKESHVKMAKQFSKNGISIVTKNNFISKEKNVVISDFDNNDDDNAIRKLSKYMQKGLLMFEDQTKLMNTANKISFEINQEVYFFDKTSYELYEGYQVNNLKIIKKLGHLEKSFSHFSWDEGVQQR